MRTGGNLVCDTWQVGTIRDVLWLYHRQCWSAVDVAQGMKITLEPTDPKTRPSEETHSKVSVSLPFDDLSATTAVEMVGQALIAWGFHEDNVREAMQCWRA